MRLSDKLTPIAYNQLVRDIKARAEKEGKSLSVSGTATFSVTYTVRATVEVPFEDIEVAESHPITVKADEIDGTIVIFARDITGLTQLTREELEQSVVDDIYHEITTDLDDFEVTVEDVEVDEYELDELVLDPASAKAVAEWNSAEE